MRPPRNERYRKKENVRRVTGIDRGKGNFYRKSKYEAKSKNHNFTKWPSEKAADLFTNTSVF
jgi:hypothetical protein